MLTVNGKISDVFRDSTFNGDITFGTTKGIVGGFKAAQAEYGQAISTQTYGETAPEHTNQTGWYDHTGGASGERMFVKIAGDAFTQADEDNGTWILFITGEHPKAICEIKTYINATTVLVDGMQWDQDINSAGSPGQFYTVKHPGFVTGGTQHEFSVGADGEFEIGSYSFTGRKMVDIELDSAANDTDAVSMDVNANGYTSVDGIVVNYNSGTLAAGETGGGVRVRMDVSEAAAADATTDVTAITAVVTGSGATTNAIKVLPGFTSAFHVDGATAADPDYGYEVSSGGTVETDRVNGAPGDGNAFLEAGNDLAIFDAVSDYILIGSDNQFEMVSIVLATPSSKNIVPTFWYSKTAAPWQALTIKADGTKGFTQSGLIVFNAPAGWEEDDQSLDGSAISDGYYIAIRRTFAPVIVTKPVEDHFKTYASQGAGMNIRGDGVVQLPYLGAAPASLANGMMWMESDGLHVYYNGGEQVLAP